MATQTMLSRSFKSLKPHSNSIQNPRKSSHNPPQILPPSPSSTKKPSVSSNSESLSTNPWSVYLIFSSNPPIKTYVGVTNNFSRRSCLHFCMVEMLPTLFIYHLLNGRNPMLWHSSVLANVVARFQFLFKKAGGDEDFWRKLADQTRKKMSLEGPINQNFVEEKEDKKKGLKQHNGELKGGAKASRAGRPWICACLIQGFTDKSKAYELESKWKISSRKLPRKRSSKNKEQEDKPQLLLLQHRYAALNQVKDSIDCSHLDVDWRLDPT